MRIKNIKIENYRGILNEEIEFNDKINVFIGGNGAGKTTLLEAIIASLLKLVLPLAVRPESAEFQLSDKDINYRKKYSSLYSILEFNSFDKDYEVPLFLKKGVIATNLENEKKSQNILRDFKVLLNEKISHNEFTLPIVKYYPTNRSYRIYTNSITKVYKNSKLEAWANFIHSDRSYSSFFKWFLDYETQELRMQRDHEDFNIKSPVIEDIRLAVKKALRKLNGKNYVIKSDEIKKSGTNKLIPVLVLNEEGTDLNETLDSKSEGEKSIISLITDIAYNLSIAHELTSHDSFLESAGIVLIDEIEAHLHPNWQRKIIPLLTELFPNIQFFITTHSPQVIASVNSEDIFVCENFKFDKINIKTKGTDSNTLLKYVFNSTERPKAYIELINKFEAMMDDEKSVDDIQLIIDNIIELEKEDNGTDVSQLTSELELKLAAYKFDLEHEMD